MTTYEGLLVFPERMRDEELEEARGRVVTEIERLNGKVLGSMKLGRRAFARPMKKERSGVYVRTVFEMDAAQVPVFRQRIKLNDEVVRLQVTAGDEQSLAWVQEPAETA